MVPEVTLDCRVFVATIIAMIMFASFVAFALSTASGENYKFNMTKDLIEEGRLLQFCVVDHKMLLPDIETFCSTRYGGINTPYGEAIK